MNFFKKLDKHFEEYMILFIAFIMCLFVLLRILCTLFYPDGGGAMEEAAGFCMVWMIFVSMGYCIRNKSLLKIDLFLNKYPKSVQNLLDFIGNLLLFILNAMLAYGALGYCVDTFAEGITSSALNFPMGFVYFSAVFGCLCGTFRALQAMFLQITKNFQTNGGTK